MVICTLYVQITMDILRTKILHFQENHWSFGVASLLKHTMSQLSTSAINFRAEIQEKTSPWLYIHTGVYITMGHFCHYATM